MSKKLEFLKQIKSNKPSLVSFVVPSTVNISDVTKMLKADLDN